MTSGCYCEAKFASQSSIDSYRPLIFAGMLINLHVASQ